MIVSPALNSIDTVLPLLATSSSGRFQPTVEQSFYSVHCRFHRSPIEPGRRPVHLGDRSNQESLRFELIRQQPTSL